MSVSVDQVFDASEATWPAARRWSVGPFTLRDGQGGGQRVSAATVAEAFSAAELDAAETAMHDHGLRPLFQVRGQGQALQGALEARGYTAQDETLLYVLPIEKLTDKPIPRVTAFNLWEPLAIMKEMWASDGIGAARLAVMDRAEVKTSVLARWDEKPAGAAFVGVHGRIAMVHGLVVLPHQRRQGVAEWMMRRAAIWGQARGATHIAVLCVADNTGANALYRALGFAQVGRYHYRQCPE